MDIENLIEQLNRYFEGETLPRGTALDAATALSTLQAENEKLRAELDDLRIQWDMYGGDVGITAVYKELEQVKRERDAAVSDIETAMAYPNDNCRFCKNANCQSRNGTKPCLPKWRGPQKEE